MSDSGTCWGVLAYRAAIGATAGLLLLAAAPSSAAESPAEQISQFRLKHGEVKVVRDATLDRIAMDQARAMAAKDDLSHSVLGPFIRRVAPAGAGLFRVSHEASGFPDADAGFFPQEQSPGQPGRDSPRDCP